MAEQSSHNVVELSQSTGALPLVDAATSTTTSSFALRGTLVASRTATPSSSNETHAEFAFQPAEESRGADTPGVTAEFKGGNTGAVSVNEETDTTLMADNTDPSHGATTNDMHDELGHGEHLADDRSTADVSIDASVNSDTDNSRADVSEKKDGNFHARANSVKKSTTFSKVSVTRNFLAKTATTPALVTLKAGDRPSPFLAGPQSGVKPRLVAKTGTSLQSIAKARLGLDSQGGPDASKVWNKNQPARPSPPKTFTDEELKQQYGIHLANRLQTDESGKESKWADIDDDEDDWAPETVTWVDGTKSTLNMQEPFTSPPKEQVMEVQGSNDKVEVAPTKSQAVKSAESIKPTLTSMRRPDQMKILRPGAASNLVKQSGSAAASPASDRTSLKATSPAAAPPVKSPWAPVPKVDTVSPVNPPTMHSSASQSLATQDARAYEHITSATPATPAREIAADTFDRSWRDGERGTRELFNSTNGRYEPAPEVRHGSIKPDITNRKPAVLQRPTPVPHGAEQTPSARSSSQIDGAWSRRRASSVSQSSHPSARRMSITKTSGVSSGSRDSSATAARGEQAMPSFHQRPTWNQQLPSRPEFAVEDGPNEAERMQIQDRIMREKRELAIKRRKEEEAREEIAKQERLKAKLAALEGAGKSKKERDAEAAAASATSQSLASHTDEPVNAPISAEARTTVNASESELTFGDISKTPSQLEKTPSTAISHSAQTSPSITSQVQRLEESSQLSTAVPTESLTTTSEKSPSDKSTPKPSSRTNLSPKNGSRVPFQQQSSTLKAQTSTFSAGDRKSHSAFGRSPKLNADPTFSPWGTVASTSNVWGTSGIGNGIFEGSSTYAPLPLGQSSNLPPPPSMTRPAASKMPPQPFAQDKLAPQQHNGDSRTFVSGVEARGDVFGNQSRLSGSSSAPGVIRPVHPPGPIAPPSRGQVQPQQMPRSSNTVAWQDLASDLPTQLEANSKAAEDQRNQAARVKPMENSFRETFKKASSAQSSRPSAARDYESAEFTVHKEQPTATAGSMSPAPPSIHTQPPEPFTMSSQANGSWRAPGERTVRLPDSSENSAHGGMSIQPPIAPPSAGAKPVALPPHMKPKTQIPPASVSGPLILPDESPPPPETKSHPAHDSNAHRPVVKLPPPQAKVRLPPSTTPNQHTTYPQGHPSAVMMPYRQLSHLGRPSAATPIVQNGEWQQRFRGLFDRMHVPTETPPSPPRTPPKMQHPALAVASSSRASMDDNVATVGATVSLPARSQAQQPEGPGFVDTGNMSTVPTVDYLFDEERSFGSRPSVLLPSNPRYDNSQYPFNAKNMLTLPINSRVCKPVEATSIEMLWPFYQSPNGYFLNLPGWKRQKMVAYSPEATRPHAQRRPQSSEILSRSNKHRESKDISSSSPSHGSVPKFNTNKSTKSVPGRHHTTHETSMVDGKGTTAEPRRTKWAKPLRGGHRRSSNHLASAILS